MLEFERFGIQDVQGASIDCVCSLRYIARAGTGPTWPSSIQTNGNENDIIAAMLPSVGTTSSDRYR